MILIIILINLATHFPIKKKSSYSFIIFQKPCFNKLIYQIIFTSNQVRVKFFFLKKKEKKKKKSQSELTNKFL